MKPNAVSRREGMCELVAEGVCGGGGGGGGGGLLGGGRGGVY